MSYTRPDGTTIKQGYGLFSKEAQVNKTAFLIHHTAADVIVVDEKTGTPVRAEYHFHDPKADTAVSDLANSSPKGASDVQ